MGTLRHAGSFPPAEAMGNALILSSRIYFEHQTAEGITPAVFQVRYRQLSAVRLKPSPMSSERRNVAVPLYCSVAWLGRQISPVWSEGRPAQKQGPGRWLGPMLCNARRKLRRAFQEIPRRSG